MDLVALAGLLTGPAAGLIVSLYALHKFMSFQRDVTDKLIAEMKLDREQNREAIDRIDNRLHVLEKLVSAVLQKD